MKISTLEMIGFKKHIEPMTMIFTDQTEISGQNGSGKSTTADAITFVLFGTDAAGGKFEPANLKTGDDVKVAAEIEVKGDKHKLERRVTKGKIQTFINEAPVTATEFKDFTEGLFQKDLFLTLFNPNYFAGLHWKAQRELMMQYVQQPLNADVLKEIPPVMAGPLEEALKKMDLDKLEGKHKLKSREAEDRLIQLRGSIETYEKTSSTASGEDTKALEDRLEELKLNIQINQEQAKAHAEATAKDNSLSREIDQVIVHINEQKNLVNTLAQVGDLICRTCGQDLPEEKAQKAEEHRQEELAAAKAKGKELVAKRNELIAEKDALQIPEKPDYVGKLQDEAMDLRERIAAHKSRDFSKEIAAAKEEQQAVIKQKKESVGLLDAIAAFRIKKTEVTVRSVNRLFDRLTVKLFDQQKNGEQKPTFEIEYDGKPYRLLSTAERILAGLEVRNAFITLTEAVDIEIPPTFIDCAESISQDVSHLVNGQAIIARVTTDPFTVKHGKGIEA